ETIPTPVMTTRGRISARLPAELNLDQLHRVVDAADPRLNVFGLRLQVEFVLDDNERLDDRERIQAEVLDEPRIVRDPVDGDARDSPDGLFDPKPDLIGAHRVSPDVLRLWWQQPNVASSRARAAPMGSRKPIGTLVCVKTNEPAGSKVTQLIPGPAD